MKDLILTILFLSPFQIRCSGSFYLDFMFFTGMATVADPGVRTPSAQTGVL